MGAQWAAEERRAWYLRLAMAATMAAARIPMPKAKAAYLRLARHMKWEAEHVPGAHPTRDLDRRSRKD